MKYKLILTGGDKVIISQERKEEIQKLLLRNVDTYLDIDGEFIKTSTIKSILKYEEQGVNPVITEQIREQENRAWSLQCQSESQRTAEEKTKIEMETRILPGWSIAGLLSDDPVLADIYVAIQDFFDKNSLYPRCPMKVWWPFFADKIAPESEIKLGKTVIKKRPNPNIYFGRWFKYIKRNDETIEAWVNYQK